MWVSSFTMIKVKGLTLGERIKMDEREVSLFFFLSFFALLIVILGILTAQNILIIFIAVCFFVVFQASFLSLVKR